MAEVVIDADHVIELSNGRFNGTTPAQLETLLDHASSAEVVVVHFHGGLVNQAAGLSTAALLGPRYESAGAYPVFFVWEAGWDEVLLSNLREIAKEDLFQRLLTRVLQFVAGKLSDFLPGRGPEVELPGEFAVEAELARLNAGELPYESLRVNAPEVGALTTAERAQFERTIATDAQLAEFVSGVAVDQAGAQLGGRGAGVTPRKSLMSPQMKRELATEAQAGTRALGSAWVAATVTKRAVSVLVKVVSRLRTGRDHGVYATVVEELLRGFYLANAGQFVWRQMKKATAEAFRGDAAAGGRAFVEGIAARWSAGKRPRYVLVGHSTGAVYICNLLRYARGKVPDGVQFDVIFLAPACTFELLNEALTEARELVRGLRSFALSDERERADKLLGNAYPHSLLYFVSGVVEDAADTPIVGMQRFDDASLFSGDNFPAIAAVRTFIAASPNRAIWSPSRLGLGLETDAASHSSFDDADPQTTASLAHILSKGLA